MATLEEIINIVETMLYKTEYNIILAEREVSEEQKQGVSERMIVYHSKSTDTEHKKG